MQPSGLIFLVIIAIWAAYLLQHWVRRREHLATARSVDRFSDAMRVLERRTPLPESELSLPQPRSYSVSPARPSRAEVVVKRAQSPMPSAQSRPAAAAPSAPDSAASRHVLARRIRGLSLVASLLLVITVSPLAVFSVLPWWSVPIVVTTLVADFAWLRHAAVTERVVRRASRWVGPANQGSGAAEAPARPDRVLAPWVKAAAPRSALAAAASSSRPAVQVEPVLSNPSAAATEVAATSETSAGAVASAGAVESAVEVDLSGWAPVPVPPPTYTLKARAERPEPVTVTAADPSPTQPSSFDGLVEEGELDDLLDRRRAAGA